MGSMTIPLDSRLKSCIKAAAKATTTGVYPKSVTNIPDIDPDMEIPPHILPQKYDDDNEPVCPDRGRGRGGGGSNMYLSCAHVCPCAFADRRYAVI